MRVQIVARWLLTLVVLPLALIAALEGALRAFDYGDSRAVFKRESIAGIDCYTRNMAFLDAFFPFHREFGMVQFPVKKDPGAYRVFVLGSSAALGMPDPAFSLGRYLETMLRARVRGKRVEMNTVASAAINSHVVRQVAKACAQCDPDLFVVYMGNNEVVGPYGPATAFGAFDRSLAAIRFKIWLQTLRITQLAAQIKRDVLGREDPSLEWLGMQMFEHPVAAGDSRLEATYAHFQANLEDIISEGRDAGADVVVCTVGSNLKDLAPFMSLHGDAQSPEGPPAWREHFEAGLQAQNNNDHAKARDAFQQAMTIDPMHAATAWYYGRALFAFGEPAATAFMAARDLDALRFRLDSRLNAVIRAVAQEHANSGVMLADVEQALNAASPGGVAGDEMFLEHVHFSDAGTHAAAAAIYAALGSQLTPDRLDAGDPPDRAACDAVLALTQYDQIQHRIEMLPMFQRPPFTKQVGAAERSARFRREMLQLPTESPVAMERALRETEQALQARPGDYWLRKKQGILLGILGDHEQAVRVLITLLADCPSHNIATLLGLALIDAGKPDEAIRYFEDSLRSTPGDAVQYVNIGWAQFKAGRVDEAVKAYLKALEIDPKLDLAHNNLGLALAAMGKNQEAERMYRKALAANWRFDKAYGNLDDAMKARLSPEQRAAAWKEIAAELPESPAPFYRAGRAYAEAGKLTTALAAYQETLDRDPLYVEAYIEMGLLAERQDDLQTASENFKEALALSPNHYFANNNLGYCLHRQGKSEDALPLIRKAVGLNPYAPVALKNLDDVLRAMGDPSAHLRTWEKIAAECPKSEPVRQYLLNARNRQ